MFCSRPPEEEDEGFSEKAAYICICGPCWECVLDDYDHDRDSLTLRHRVQDWNTERKFRNLQRIESKKLEKSKRKVRRRRSSRGLS